MRLPNGYGSVRKLSGKRRRPWMVEKTVGWELDLANQKIRQKRVTIGYYVSQSAALAALAQYNENPYDIDARTITFSKLYEKWSERKFEQISESNAKGYAAVYRLCQDIYNIPFRDLKLSHLQHIVDASGKNTPTLRKLKVLFSQLYEFAVINEVISKDKNFVEYLDIKSAGNPNSLDRCPFTKTEIARLWENVSCNEYISVVLMMIYSGVRVSELLDLKKDDVHLSEKWFYIRHSKTAAGVRSVPIADKVYPFFRDWLSKNDCDYLLSTPAGKKFVYYNFNRAYWMPIMEALGMNHKPHDTRHTTISLLAQEKVYPTTIKKIVGHSGAQTLTERVYTHMDIQELIDAINLI